MSLPNLSSFYPKDKKEEKKDSSVVEETPAINPDGLKDNAKHVTPVTELKETLQKERKESLFRIQSYISLPYLSAHSRLKSIKNHKGYTRI